MRFGNGEAPGRRTHSEARHGVIVTLVQKLTLTMYLKSLCKIDSSAANPLKYRDSLLALNRTGSGVVSDAGRGGIRDQMGASVLGWARFPEALSALEVEQFFTLDPSELSDVCRRRRTTNRLGLALQIGFVRMTGAPLNSVEIVPQRVLEHLARQLGRPMPRITSIRALYRRQPTLFNHQQAALAAVGFRDLSVHAERALVAFLRREAADEVAIDEVAIDKLVERARVWLFEHRHVIPPRRRLAVIAAGARKHHDELLSARIEESVDAAIRHQWVHRLAEIVDDKVGLTRLDWLREGPISKRPHGIEDHVAKIEFLRNLGADKLKLDISLAALEHYARPVHYRKPAAMLRTKSSRRFLELACFLRLQLLRHTDRGLELLDHRIADLWRSARARVEEGQSRLLQRYRRLVSDIAATVANTDLPVEALRERISGLIAPFSAEKAPSKAAQIRAELAHQTVRLKEVLTSVRAIGLDLPEGHPLATAFAVLDDVAASGTNSLPASATQPFGPTWAMLIGQPYRDAALDSYRAATVMLYKRSVRNGSASVEHSIDHRAPKDRLIPAVEWERDRARFTRDLIGGDSMRAYLDKIQAGLTAGLAAVDEAVGAGALDIDNGRLIVPRIKPAPKDPHVEQTRRLLSRSFGDVQLPDVLIEVDARTHFSWTLLERPPRSELELVTLYAALIAWGTDMNAVDLVRMTPGIAIDSVGQMMTRLEAGGCLREANRVVMAHFRALPIAGMWGEGLAASADMMSLEATRYLWSARLDPRRRTYAIGTYAHVVDQWGIIYDQPIVLNRRQAGPAIEGALRQEFSTLERVAVDTHGFTHLGMTVAKLSGFDLCPRVAGSRDRKLYLPRGFHVPERLRDVVRETVSLRTIERGSDPLLHVCASVKTGWCSPTYILERYGSANRNDPAARAGNALGKLLLTLYFCDYLSNPEFRRYILELLNQGESVHALQRAIHRGGIGAKRGRTPEQLAAISGALSLLANIVMTWNALRMQTIINQTPADFPTAVMSQIAPVPHAHINMRGVFTFDVGRHRHDLFSRRSPLRRAGS
jgi:TnpA family transposase